MTDSLLLHPTFKSLSLDPMSIFPNAQNIVVTKSQFKDKQLINISGGPTGIDILLEASTPSAAYDSSARHPPPKCFPGTRVQYVEDALHWALPTIGDTPLPMFWMKGPAGVGKSAVAQTCVEELKARGKLGAAFFFSVNGRNKPIHFFPTVAYQLSIEFPQYRDLVEQRVRLDKTLLDKAMASQFRGLIVEPLQELQRNGKGIGNRVPIFIDGLDECESADAQCELIEIIATAARSGNTPFCWAFFTRPEPHIETTFAQPEIATLCHKVVLPISREADGEIELYLRSGFENILRRHNISMESPWPSDAVIQSLVDASGGLFVYPATLLRFLSQPGSSGPEEPLRAVLAVISSRKAGNHSANTISKSPFAELDAFYTLVMQRIPVEMLPTVRLLFASVCHRKYTPRSLGVIYQSNVLGMSRLDFGSICNQLSAILQFHNCGEPLKLDDNVDTSRPFQYASREVIQELWLLVCSRLGGSISFYHKSFYDFLVDPTRSGDFCVMSPVMRRALFKHCLELQLKYQEGIALQGSNIVLAHCVPDSASSLSYPYTSELVNSIVKAKVYDSLHGVCLELCDSPSLDPRLQRQLCHVDFRKSLCAKTSLYAGHVGFLCFSVWGYAGRSKVIGGTQLFRLLPDEFSRFDICEFQKIIAQKQQLGIIQPYYPNFTAWLKSFFGDKSQDHVISGLYRMGRDSQSIFWYWEINLESGYYQEFRAIDLAEGERVYREEQFDLWDKSGQWWQ